MMTRKTSSTTRWARLILAVLMVACSLAVGTAAGLVSLTTEVHAEERPQTLFKLLFGNRNKEKPKAAKPSATPRAASKERRTGAISNRASTAVAPAVARQPEAVEKLENARKILVMGDFTAGASAAGLVAAYAQSTDVVVLDVSNGSSGLVRDDHFNWPGSAPGLIEEHKPAVVVVMLGANDRQAMLVGTTREQVRTEPWLNEYRARARRFAEAVTATGTPLVWISQVPYRFSSMTADMLVFNDIYQNVAQSVNGVTFVDVWEGFVDEEGKFVTRGPDINGQIVALRSGDVNLTRAGARKIAFYAEKALNRILGEGGPIPGVLTDENLPNLSLTPGADLQAAFDRLRPVPVNSPTLDGGDALLGSAVVPGPDADRLGNPASEEGRITDFTVGLR